MIKLIVLLFLMLHPCLSFSEKRQHPSVAKSRMAKWLISDEQKACVEKYANDDARAAADRKKYNADYETEKAAASERKLDYERKNKMFLEGSGDKPMLPMPMAPPPALSKKTQCYLIPEDFRVDLVDD